MIGLQSSPWASRVLFGLSEAEIEEQRELLREILDEVTSSSPGLIDWMQIIVPPVGAMIVVFLGWYWSARQGREQRDFETDQWTKEMERREAEFRNQRKLDLDKELWREERVFWVSAIAEVAAVGGEIRAAQSAASPPVDVQRLEHYLAQVRRVVDACSRVQERSTEMLLMASGVANLTDAVVRLDEFMAGLNQRMRIVASDALGRPASQAVKMYQSALGEVDLEALQQLRLDILDIVRTTLADRVATSPEE